MSMTDQGGGATQATSGATDVVIQLRGIVQQLSAWVLAFQGRVTLGNFTMAAAASTTINNTAVKANSKITPIPTNASAGTLMGSAKSLYISAKSAGVSFTVSTANAASAAGTETFDYIINTPS